MGTAPGAQVPWLAAWEGGRAAALPRLRKETASGTEAAFTSAGARDAPGRARRARNCFPENAIIRHPRMRRARRPGVGAALLSFAAKCCGVSAGWIGQVEGPTSGDDCAGGLGCVGSSSGAQPRDAACRMRGRGQPGQGVLALRRHPRKAAQPTGREWAGAALVFRARTCTPASRGPRPDAAGRGWMPAPSPWCVHLRRRPRRRWRRGIPGPGRGCPPA
jgi:hypothetical protein